MMRSMRTTINIDDELLRRLKRQAQRENSTLGATMNRVLQAGLERMHPSSARPAYQCPTFSMGFPPLPNLDKALQLASMLEDEEVLHKLSLRK